MQAIVDSLAPYAAHVGVAVIAGALLIQFLPLSLGQLAPTPEVGGYPGGLYNPGNYCFVNSVIQSLVNLKSLQDELSNPGGPVGAALATLAKQLNATHSYPLICTNNALLVAINSKGGNDHLVGYNQQDAHELFQVVSALYDNELKPSCKATMQLVDESQYFKAVFLGKGCQIPVPKISRSPFSGLMASRICCLKCCYKVFADLLRRQCGLMFLTTFL